MNKKNKLLQVRVTEEQYEKFIELAEIKDQTRSEIIREAIDRAIRKLGKMKGGETQYS